MTRSGSADGSTESSMRSSRPVGGTSRTVRAPTAPVTDDATSRPADAGSPVETAATPPLMTSAVPEPSTLAMLGLGALTLLATRKRRVR